MKDSIKIKIIFILILIAFIVFAIIDWNVRCYIIDGADIPTWLKVLILS